MEIISYMYHQNKEVNKWSIAIEKFGKFNLLVGDTGTGKTRFLNTLF